MAETVIERPQLTSWAEIRDFALEKVKEYPEEYSERLKFEIKEIEKQATGEYWLEQIIKGTVYDTNVNGLVLPLLLGITSVDPIVNKIPHVVVYQFDFPDVDIDLLPGTREKIEQFAAAQYGEDKVCSVGLWQTYKPKLAMQDAARALNREVDPIIKLTKLLPEEFDDLPLDTALKDFADFRAFYETPLEENSPSKATNKDLVQMAYRMVNLIKAQGRHAGGLIIANVPIRDHVPMTICSGRWTSAWTEGRNNQLSKFGFVKFDLLGLKTLLYIRTCLDLVKANRNHIIEWTDIDPKANRAGWKIDENGHRWPIQLEDKNALSMAHQLRTETVFQFETDLAKSILIKGGVKTLNDLIVYTSLGRPGPLPMIDPYIRRRDGKEEWKKGEHPTIIEKLQDTFGIITYQEQLAAIWMALGGFTAPEAEAARKAVAKKWVEKLAPIEQKWLNGAKRTLGGEKAKEWWDRMVTFGRYAFNKSHATAYVLVSQRCLWLKAHYPAEWWAAVMSDCDNDRLSKYMGFARADGVKFGSYDVDKLTLKFTAVGDLVSPGLTAMKGVGYDLSKKIVDKGLTYTSIDDFVEKNGRHKTVCEGLIKLGAFDKKHVSRKATWYWYQYEYGANDDAKEMRKFLKCAFAWPEEAIQAERQRQIAEFRAQYPKRNKIPPKIEKWLPRVPYKRDSYELPTKISEKQYESAKFITLTREHIEMLFKSDFGLKEILDCEQAFLGYYFHSPLDLYKHDDKYTIPKARTAGILEGVIQKFTVRKKQTEFGEIILTDGYETAKVMIWGDELYANGLDVFKPGVGVRLRVNWKDQFKSFNVKSGTNVIPLMKVDDAAQY